MKTHCSYKKHVELKECCLYSTNKERVQPEADDHKPLLQSYYSNQSYFYHYRFSIHESLQYCDVTKLTNLNVIRHTVFSQLSISYLVIRFYRSGMYMLIVSFIHL